jgi:CDGSH-type Zn-finger protein
MSDMRIQITADGPYEVHGGVPLVRIEIVTNEDGEAIGWREVERFDVGSYYMLCRCGHSHDKPFCDFSHGAAGFDGTETAQCDPYFENAESIDGPGVRLRDVRVLCAEARFCDRGGGLWNLIEKCDDAQARALAEEEAMLCPSGRYVLVDDSGTAREPELDKSIALVEDPALGVSGPLFVRGGIQIVAADGREYEVRNRVTLCRCGASENKPFCDGSHIAAEFRDE